MPITLVRVDERLIHGQVVIAWGHQLRPDIYIVIDDDLATSEWEQDLYRLGAGDAETAFHSVESARASLVEWREGPRRSILLVRDLRTMRRLAENRSFAGERLNLGGIHHGPGRDEVLTYLHLTPQDRDDLRAIAEQGVEVSARDLPDAPRVSLATLLRK